MVQELEKTKTEARRQKIRNGGTGDGRRGGEGKDLDRERKDLKKLGFDKIQDGKSWRKPNLGKNNTLIVGQETEEVEE